jgi:hypothetical protein
MGAAGAKLVVSVTELSGSFVLLSVAAPDALSPSRLWRSLSRDIVAAAAFVGVVAAAVGWLGDRFLVYPAFAVCSVAYLLVFWNSLTDSIDRNTIVHLQDWLRRKWAQPL